VTTYAVALSKGGSTKTTTAAEIVVALAAKGRKVLAIDLDQQGNLTTRLGVARDAEVAGVTADVLTGESSAEEAAIAAPSVPGAFVLAGTHDLAKVDTQSVPDLVTALRDHLAATGHLWDDVVIDTPPSLTGLTLAGLAAADVVVAAVACEVEAYDQLGRLTDVIEHRLARRVRPGLALQWIVPTRYDGRRGLDRELVELLNEKHPHQVTSPIREAVAVRDAYTAGMPVSIYDPRSKIAADYAAAVAPIIRPSTGE